MTAYASLLPTVSGGDGPKVSDLSNDENLKGLAKLVSRRETSPDNKVATDDEHQDGSSGGDSHSPTSVAAGPRSKARRDASGAHNAARRASKSRARRRVNSDELQCSEEGPASHLPPSLRRVISQPDPKPRKILSPTAPLSSKSRRKTLAGDKLRTPGKFDAWMEEKVDEEDKPPRELENRSSCSGERKKKAIRRTKSDPSSDTEGAGDRSHRTRTLSSDDAKVRAPSTSQGASRTIRNASVHRTKGSNNKEAKVVPNMKKRLPRRTKSLILARKPKRDLINSSDEESEDSEDERAKRTMRNPYGMSPKRSITRQQRLVDRGLVSPMQRSASFRSTQRKQLMQGLDFQDKLQQKQRPRQMARASSFRVSKKKDLERPRQMARASSFRVSKKKDLERVQRNSLSASEHPAKAAYPLRRSWHPNTKDREKALQEFAAPPPKMPVGQRSSQKEEETAEDLGYGVPFFAESQGSSLKTQDTAEVSQADLVKMVMALTREVSELRKELSEMRSLSQSSNSEEDRTALHDSTSGLGGRAMPVRPTEGPRRMSLYDASDESDSSDSSGY